jgi:hypothetical protein
MPLQATHVRNAVPSLPVLGQRKLVRRESLMLWPDRNDQEKMFGSSVGTGWAGGMFRMKPVLKQWSGRRDSIYTTSGNSARICGKALRTYSIPWFGEKQAEGEQHHLALDSELRILEVSFMSLFPVRCSQQTWMRR